MCLSACGIILLTCENSLLLELQEYPQFPCFSPQFLFSASVLAIASGDATVKLFDLEKKALPGGSIVGSPICITRVSGRVLGHHGGGPWGAAITSCEVNARSAVVRWQRPSPYCHPPRQSSQDTPIRLPKDIKPSKDAAQPCVEFLFFVLVQLLEHSNTPLSAVVDL